MSTKIWTAWRVPKNKLNEFFLLVNAATMANFYERLDMWMSWVKIDKAKQRREEVEDKCRDTDGNLPTWWWRDREDPDKTYIRERWEILCERIREASASFEYNPFDADASLNVWLDGRYAYLIPYGRVKLPDSLPDWVEDYHYQDQADRPERFTARQWAARRRKWDQLCLDNNWNDTRMNHPIIDFSRHASWRSEYMVEVHLGLMPKAG
jgi:hypothetical protein